MDLKTYIADPARKDALVKALETDPGYLWQIATGWKGRQASPKFAARIEDATARVVTKESLRPDIWSAPSKPARKVAA